MSAVDGLVDELVRAARDELCSLHAELPRHGLVVWTAGNVSARVPGSDHFVIKPSASATTS